MGLSWLRSSRDVNERTEDFSTARSGMKPHTDADLLGWPNGGQTEMAKGVRRSSKGLRPYSSHRKRDFFDAC